MNQRWIKGLEAANNAPRCGVKTRSGGTCRCAGSKRNGRCRLHGSKATGPKTDEGKAKCAKAATRHGWHVAEFSEQRRRMMRLAKDVLMRVERGDEMIPASVWDACGL